MLTTAQIKDSVVVSLWSQTHNFVTAQWTHRKSQLVAQIRWCALCSQSIEGTNMFETPKPATSYRCMIDPLLRLRVCLSVCRPGGGGAAAVPVVRLALHGDVAVAAHPGGVASLHGRLPRLLVYTVRGRGPASLVAPLQVSLPVRPPVLPHVAADRAGYTSRDAALWREACPTAEGS